MKSVWSLCAGLAVAMLLTSSTFAQRPTGKPEGKGKPQQRQGPPWAKARVMFQQFDANRDGKLQRDEVPIPAWTFLSRADANKDGTVSQEEIVKLVASRLFDRFDENGDDQLTEAEVPEVAWDRFSAADVDEDGAVSYDEFIATVLATPRGGKPADAPEKPRGKQDRPSKAPADL